MAKKMEESLSIPHFGYCEEITVDALIELRKQMKQYAAAEGVKITYMPFFIKACSMGILKYPILNASINKELTEVS